MLRAARSESSALESNLGPRSRSCWADSAAPHRCIARSVVAARCSMPSQAAAAAWAKPRVALEDSSAERNLGPKTVAPTIPRGCPPDR